MPIPNYQSLMKPILELLSDHQDHVLAELRGRLSTCLGLSDADLAERLASSNQTTFSNRVAWAIQFLKAARAIEPVRRSVYRITDRGLSLLEAGPGEISVGTLRQFPEFEEFAGKGPALARTVVPVVVEDPISADPEDTPEECIERSFGLQREALAAELLESVRNGTPAAFERLVVDLLVAMGYGGSAENAGQVVGCSGDGGIDGIIKQDKLGLDSVYVQAKRWRANVGSPEIMQFSGGLTKRNASKGVVITPSDFSKDARAYVEALPQKIVLIDGKQLSSLMIEHNVGVIPDAAYTIKRINPGYFEAL